jgi:arylsulfatase A-like enzyme
MAKEEQKRPNFIFFLVDDYDKPETSVYGGDVLTPNLERLAREGITFHNAYMTSTVCTPSRYTCLTGRYAGSSYSPVYLEECPPGQQGLPAFNVALEDDNMNVAQVLADNGYATGMVGKYHVGLEFEEEECEAVGLHYLPKQVENTPTTNEQMNENEKRYRELVKERGFTWAKNIYSGNMKKAWRGHNPEWTISAALEFLEEHKDGPFYLHYCTTLLHGPNGEWYRSLDKPLVTGEGIIDAPLNVMPSRESVKERIEAAGLTPNEAGYLWMDDSLGVLLDKLEELGIAENTLVLFIADHGSELKGSLFRHRGSEVPCIMRWPAGMRQGVDCHELIQNTDFVPTWFELAKASVPKEYQLDGVSLAPLFQEPDKPVRDYVYGEMGPSRSIKTKEWSYLALRYTKEQIETVRSGSRAVKQLLGLSGGVSRAKDRPDAFSYDQLYHLANDPQEKENLADNPEHREALDKLKEQLAAELSLFPGRPYGEFIPGGNAVPAGSYDDVLARMPQIAKEAG